MRIEENLEEWVRAYYRQELSADKRMALMQWLEKSQEHERMFQKQLRLEINLSAAGSWKKWGKLEEKNWKMINEALSQYRKRLYKSWMRVAAVVLVGIGVYAGWRMQQDTVQDQGLAVNVLQTKAGAAKAFLQLANGKTLELTGMDTRRLVTENYVDVIQEAGGGVRFEEQKERNEEPDAEMNILRVPVTGEYFAILSDGTKVWINSDSRLEFPARFSQESREVKLYGEAYFEVARDESRPFFVQTDDVWVQVLGTSFNVTAYQDEKEVKIALLQGKVKLDVKKNSCVLKPGEIATLNKRNGETIVRKGNVLAMAEWRTGRFDFEDMALEELAVRLYRWYGVHFEFMNAETRLLRFSGMIMKNWRLDYALDVIGRTTDVRFVEEQGQILVYSKQ